MSGYHGRRIQFIQIKIKNMFNEVSGRKSKSKLNQNYFFFIQYYTTFNIYTTFRYSILLFKIISDVRNAWNVFICMYIFSLWINWYWSIRLVDFKTAILTLTCAVIWVKFPDGNPPSSWYSLLVIEIDVFKRGYSCKLQYCTVMLKNI